MPPEPEPAVDGQGVDVVAGRQKPRDNARLRLGLLAAWARLNDICHELEALFVDTPDFEFTVQSDVLFLLQTRRAKRGLGGAGGSVGAVVVR